MKANFPCQLQQWLTLAWISMHAGIQPCAPPCLFRQEGKEQWRVTHTATTRVHSLHIEKLMTAVLCHKILFLRVICIFDWHTSDMLLFIFFINYVIKNIDFVIVRSHISVNPRAICHHPSIILFWGGFGLWGSIQPHCVCWKVGVTLRIATLGSKKVILWTF